MKIQKLFGRETPEEHPYWQFDKENHFRPKVNLSEYYKLSGSDFVWLIVEPIFDYKPKINEIERIKHLSYGQKALSFWWILDGQVTNGGFVQYYYNDYAKFTPSVIKGLELIGNMEMCELVKKAHKIYLKERSKVEKAKEKGLFESDLYDQLSELDDLGYRYYDLNDFTMEKFEKYIRSHPDQFCLGDNGQEIDLNFSGILKGYFDNGDIQSEFELKNGQANGAAKSFHGNGNLKEVVVFKDGIETGEKKSFYKNGVLKLLVSGVSEGRLKHEEYHENEKMKATYFTLNSKDVGPTKKWHSNGIIEEQGQYNEVSQRIGMWCSYYDNGQIREEREHEDGEPMFKNFWLENGEQILKNGTGIRKSSFEGTINETPYKNYRLHGLYKATRANGILHYTVEYVEGLKHGLNKTYYDNGAVKEERLYENGKQVSVKEFPKFQNPKVIAKIKCEVQDEWLITRELEIADSYPILLNLEVIEKSFDVGISLFDGFSYEENIRFMHWVTIGARGNAVEMDYLSGYGEDLLGQIEDGIRKMEFKPAIRDGRNVESYSMITHRFIVVDGNE